MKKIIEAVNESPSEILFGLLSALGLFFGANMIVNPFTAFFYFVEDNFRLLWMLVYSVLFFGCYLLTKEISLNEKGKKIFSRSFLISSILMPVIYFLIPFLLKQKSA